MKTVKVRNIVIGEGIPKICVPVFERTGAEIMEAARQAACLEPDIVEFRADRYEHYQDPGCLTDILSGIRSVLGDTPFLFTIRTVDEGGEADIDAGCYEDIIIKACESGLIDLVDVEALGRSDAVRIIEAARSKGVKTIASYHDFEKTADKDGIKDILSDLERSGADILKIAVMPRSFKDVVSLLSAAGEAARGSDRPIAAISMSDMGSVSRVAAEMFGSAITFGAASASSAPGQPDAESLRDALELFHESLVSKDHV